VQGPGEGPSLVLVHFPPTTSIVSRTRDCICLDACVAVNTGGVVARVHPVTARTIIRASTAVPKRRTPVCSPLLLVENT
jgi:hypothetical protein